MHITIQSAGLKRCRLAAALLLAALFSLAAYAASPPAAKVFPLKPGETCLACHGDLQKKKLRHAAIEDAASCTAACHVLIGPSQHAFKPRPAKLSTICFSCHDPFSAKKSQHSPTADGDCSACHDPHQSDEAKLLRQPAAKLCFECHDRSAFEGTGSSHGPAHEGTCLACHNPHAAEQPRLLSKAQPELCFGCHTVAMIDSQKVPMVSIRHQFDDDQAEKHPPFEEGTCTECHHPHASANVRLLTASYPPKFYAAFTPDSYALCFRCHEKRAFVEPRTLTATAFRNGNLNLHYRHVNKTKGRSCRACHAPHGSRQKALISGVIRFGERGIGMNYTVTDNGGKCVSSCHVPASYDRVKPVSNPLRTTPRSGQDASTEELLRAAPPKKSPPPTATPKGAPAPAAATIK